jgi:hypothetical protein
VAQATDRVGQHDNRRPPVSEVAPLTLDSAKSLTDDDVTLGGMGRLSMRVVGALRTKAALAGLLLTSCAAMAHVEVEFIPYSAAHGYAASTYQNIWHEYGNRIIESLERRTCLPFTEPRVAAIIADGVSHSGGPEHPMQLRASYRYEMKKSTLVHELGHRHLWQLVERLEDLDGHHTLFLILDLVWADVWGNEFAAERVQGESEWQARYDYASAWTWARTLQPEQRARLWSELLTMNGLGSACPGLFAGQH